MVVPCAAAFHATVLELFGAQCSCTCPIRRLATLALRISIDVFGSLLPSYSSASAHAQRRCTFAQISVLILWASITFIPLSLGRTIPRERDWRQTAYQVLVASSEDKLRKGFADVWDSGRRTSSDSVNIAYAGPALQSRRRYFWLVHTWNARGQAEFAAKPAHWEMGLLQPADWQANWIHRSDTRADALLRQVHWLWLPQTDPHQVAPGIEAEFRYVLHLNSPPDMAVLHVLAGADFTTRVNGAITGHKDAWGAFDREDIRDQLRFGKGTAGDNSILVHVTVPRAGSSVKPTSAALAAALQFGSVAGPTRWIVTDKTWQVRQVTMGELQAWSVPQVIGPLASHGFGVGTDRVALALAPERIDSSTALFRRSFTPRGSVISARLYITALGSYRASLNGTEIGQSTLAPGFTDYRKRVLYQTYDVTAMLRSGQNTLGAVLAAGWHGSPLVWSGTRVFPGPDRLRAQLELQLADGSVQVIGTGSDWHTSSSPTLSSEIYAGEAYDARLEQRGWNTAAFDETDAWSPATEDAAVAGLAITAQPDLPVHRAETLTPVNIAMIGPDQAREAVFDMGQNMVGTARLRVRGSRGTTVRLRFAERLNPDGSVYTANLRDADATDLYTLSGQGDEEWTPAFTFHGFRYVQVSGYPGTPPLSALEGQVLNSLPAFPSMRLETSSDLLNRMGRLGLWGQRGNFLSIPTDCPQRDERMGWMGDAGVFWRTGAYNFDTDAFSHKFMQDVTDAQGADGTFTNISPNILAGEEGHPGAPGWGDAGVLIPYATWLQYGDAALVERSWPAMQQWMNFILRTNPGFVREHDLGANYADWLAPDPHTPRDLVATAYWALLAQQMRSMATALNDSNAAAKYAMLIMQIRSAYQQRYIHADGSVAGDTQTAYVLTLAAHLAPENLEPALTDRLVRNIEAHQTHLTTGFLGTPFLLSVLDEHGRSNLAFRLLLSTSYPSWGYMVEKGATTWWERWNGDTGDPAMNSYNHYAFGSVMAWVYRRVAGIDTDAVHPGFHHIVIGPHPDAALTHVHAEYDSVYGTILTDWTTGERGALHLTVRVPANTTATVSLPITPVSVVEQDGNPVSLRAAAGISTFEIGSGTYSFNVHEP